MQAAVHAATSLLPPLRQGLTPETAKPAVRALRLLTGAQAVALADGQTVLAFDGEAADHHRGDALATLTGRADRVHVERHTPPRLPAALRPGRAAVRARPARRHARRALHRPGPAAPGGHRAWCPRRRRWWPRSGATLRGSRRRASGSPAPSCAPCARRSRRTSSTTRWPPSPRSSTRARRRRASCCPSSPSSSATASAASARTSRSPTSSATSRSTCGSSRPGSANACGCAWRWHPRSCRRSSRRSPCSRWSRTRCATGWSRGTGGGRWRSWAADVGSDVGLRVVDDGAGMDPDGRASALAGNGGGIGLHNVHSRLRATFGDGYGLQLGRGPGGAPR